MSEIESATIRGLFTLNTNVNGSRYSLNEDAYRPNHQFEEYPSTFIGFVEFEGGKCSPGSSIEAIIKINYSSDMKYLLKPENIWVVKEWPEVVGKVRILEVEFES